MTCGRVATALRLSSTSPAAAIFVTKTAAEWAEILANHDCRVEVIVEPDGLPAHPLHVAREVFFTIDNSEGVGR